MYFIVPKQINHCLKALGRTWIWDYGIKGFIKKEVRPCFFFIKTFDSSVVLLISYYFQVKNLTKLQQFDGFYWFRTFTVNYESLYNNYPVS